jgi:hypothetical protein
MQEGRSFDTFYVTNLSDDAVPALLKSMETMSFEQQCVVKRHILRRFEKAQSENDFRTFNWSRWTARKEMTQYSENLDVSNCPAQVQRYNGDF